MKTSNKYYYIRGNAKHPDKVLEALRAKGATDNCSWDYGIEDTLYFIDTDQSIHHTSDNGILGSMLIEFGTELYIEPDYKFKIGDKVKWGCNIYVVTAQKNFRDKPGYKLNYSIEVPEDALTLYKEQQIKTWEDLEKADKFISGYAILSNTLQPVTYSHNNFISKSVATSEKVAKAMLAMAQISQLMPYYGGEITDEEWQDEDVEKFVIRGYSGDIEFDYTFCLNYFLAFHTEEQRDDFYKNNRQLVHDYLMID